MSLTRLGARLRARLACVRPTRLAVLLRDRRGVASVDGCDDAHLAAAMQWLCRAHDAGLGGVSAEYRLVGGWGPPYPETSGYIIPTFLDYVARSGETSYATRASSIGDWEIEIQMPDGAVRGGQGINDYPIVFNTGQVMIGWNALYRETATPRFLEAALRAGRWLARVQETRGSLAGCWTKHTLHEEPHAYHTRVAWPVLETARLAQDSVLLDSGRRFVEWVLSQATANGWIEFMAFRVGEPALTHTIAYTARGLLECATALDGCADSFADDPDALRALARRARHAARAIADRMLEIAEASDRAIPATIARGWLPAECEYSCLTGNAQLAIIWTMLPNAAGDSRYLRAARRELDRLKATQSLTSREPGIRGGIAGSFPIWGQYIQLSYPNWAAKFFADALMANAGSPAAVGRRPSVPRG